MTTTIEKLIDEIASSLHATATQKTDARAAKKVVGLVRSLDSVVVAQSVLALTQRDSRVRDYLPQWNEQIKDRSRLRDIIVFSAELAGSVTVPQQTALVSRHLDALRKAPHTDEVKPYLKELSAAPQSVRDKLVKVLKIAVNMDRAITQKNHKLEAISLPWYSFLYLVHMQSDVIEEIILECVAEGDFETATDAAKLHKKFNSASSRVKRAKNLFGKIRGAANTVEYTPELGIRGYSQKVREKALVQ